MTPNFQVAHRTPFASEENWNPHSHFHRRRGPRQTGRVAPGKTWPLDAWLQRLPSANQCLGKSNEAPIPFLQTGRCELREEEHPRKHIQKKEKMKDTFTHHYLLIHDAGTQTNAKNSSFHTIIPWSTWTRRHTLFLLHGYTERSTTFHGAHGLEDTPIVFTWHTPSCT